MAGDNETTLRLAKQYFSDLETDRRADSPENVRAWLWFTCPAELRGQVAEQIARLRATP